MNPIAPTLGDGAPVIYGKNQPEYIPLPARLCADGRIITEWQLSEEERGLIMRGENVRLTVARQSTGALQQMLRQVQAGQVSFDALFRHLDALQPIKLEITTPEGG